MSTQKQQIEAPASTPPRTILVDEYFLALRAFRSVPVFHIDKQITYITTAPTIGPTMYAVRYNGSKGNLYYIDGNTKLYTITPWTAQDAEAHHG